MEGRSLAALVAHLPLKRQGLLVKGERLALVAQGRVDQADVVEGRSLAALVAHLPLKRQGLLVEGERLMLVVQGRVDQADAVENRSLAALVIHLPLQRQGLLVEGECLAIVAQGRVDTADVGQHRRLFADQRLRPRVGYSPVAPRQLVLPDAAPLLVGTQPPDKLEQQRRRLVDRDHLPPGKAHLLVDRLDTPPVRPILLDPLQIVPPVPRRRLTRRPPRHRIMHHLVNRQHPVSRLHQVAMDEQRQHGGLRPRHRFRRSAGEGRWLGGEGAQRPEGGGCFGGQGVHTQADHGVEGFPLARPAAEAFGRQRQPLLCIPQRRKGLRHQVGEDSQVVAGQVAAEHFEGQRQLADGGDQPACGIRVGRTRLWRQPLQQLVSGIGCQHRHRYLLSRPGKVPGDFAVSRRQQVHGMRARQAQRLRLLHIPGVVDHDQHAAVAEHPAQPLQTPVHVRLVGQLCPQRLCPLVLHRHHIGLLAQTAPQHAVGQRCPHPLVVRQRHGQGRLAHAGHAVGGEGGAVAGDETGNEVGEQVVAAEEGGGRSGRDGDPEIIGLNAQQRLLQQQANVPHLAQRLRCRGMGVPCNQYTPEVIERALHILGRAADFLPQMLQKQREAALQHEGDARQALRPVDGAEMGVHALVVERSAQDGGFEHRARYLGQSKVVAEHLAQRLEIAGAKIGMLPSQAGFHLA